jgi:hypothetical protein
MRLPGSHHLTILLDWPQLAQKPPRDPLRPRLRRQTIAILFFLIKDKSTVMSYKKKVPHIKGNEAKPYNAQLIVENRVKTQHDATPPHPGKGNNQELPKRAPSCNVVPRQN